MTYQGGKRLETQDKVNSQKVACGRLAIRAFLVVLSGLILLCPKDVMAAADQGCTGVDAGPLPSSAISVSTKAGDFDGDGTEDRLIVYGMGTAEETREWRVRVILASNRTVDYPLDAVGRAQILGSFDINGNGEEVFVELDHGASTIFVGIFTFFECGLHQVNVAGKEKSTFGIGGTVTHMGFIDCDPKGFSEYQIVSSEGEEYTRETTRYVLLGRELTLQTVKRDKIDYKQVENMRSTCLNADENSSQELK